MKKETKYEANCPDYNVTTDSWEDNWKPISRQNLRKWWKEFSEDMTDDFKPTFSEFLVFQIGYVGALREAK